MEQVTGIEPVSEPWQGPVIATILYLLVVVKMYQEIM